MIDPLTDSPDSSDSHIESALARNEKSWWLDNKDNVSKLVYTLYAFAALLFLADFVYHKHIYFNFENWIGFYSWFGFISCVGLVFLAVPFRRLVKRDEGYYDK